MEHQRGTAVFGGNSEQSFTVSLPALPLAPEKLRTLSPVLLTGPGAISAAHTLLWWLIARGQKAVVADGANRFDAYKLARGSEDRSFRHLPPGQNDLEMPAAEVLGAVRVSRAFTWQQYQVLLEREVAPEAARSGARWVLALGPLDLLADEEAKPFQAFRGARRVANALETLARAGLGVVVAQDEGKLARSGRAELLERLRPACVREFIVATKTGSLSSPSMHASPASPLSSPHGGRRGGGLERVRRGDKGTGNGGVGSDTDDGQLDFGFGGK